MRKLFLAVIPLTLIGCASMNSEKYKAAEHVKITSLAFLEKNHGCDNRGKVSGNSAGEMGGEAAAIKHLKVKAHELGANVVVSSLNFKKTAGFFAPADSLNGIAFKCSEQEFAKITSIEQLADF